MVDNLALLLSHGMLLVVILRLVRSRDPDDNADVRRGGAAKR